MSPADTPLPMPIDGAVPTRDDVLSRLRDVYGQALDEIMTRVLAEVLLPNDQAAVCLDFAQMAAFLMCIKVVEAKRQPLTRENLMAVWWPFQKALKDEVPGRLREFADELAGRG